MNSTALVAAMETDIDNGRFGKSGTRLPAVRTLADMYGVAFVTALHAVHRLKESRMIMSVGAKNYICCGQAERHSDLFRETHAQKKIGIHVRQLNNLYFSTIIEHLNVGLIRAGFLPVVLSSSNDPELECRALERFLEDGCAGLISFIGRTDEIVHLYSRYPLPTVLIGHTPVGINAASVTSDNRQAGMAAVKHLTECGYTRFVYVGSSSSAEGGDERLAGFREGLRRAGKSETTDSFTVFDDTVSDRYIVSVLQSLAAGSRIGVFCYHDLIAAKLLPLIEAAGIPVPDRVGIIGYDDLPSVTQFGLTTFAYNFNLMADTAIRLLSEITVNPAARRNESIQTVLLMRGTTARPDPAGSGQDTAR